MPGVDVVVVSFNSRDLLRRAVAPYADADDVDVIVVDNASPDRSLEAVEDLPGITTIQRRTNDGFGCGCNVGWRTGRRPYVLFLNPDAVLDLESLGRLVDVLEDDDSVGAVAPRIVDESGRLDYSIRRFPRLSSTFAQALFVHRLFPQALWVDEVVRAPEAYLRPGLVEWASGACLLVRRIALELLDGFDESFFMYCEDKDLCRRLWDNGYKVAFEPNAISVHVGHASAPHGALLPTLAASRLRYARKHRSPAGAALERLGIAAGSFTHALVTTHNWSVRVGHARAFVTALGVAPSRAS